MRYFILFSTLFFAFCCFAENSVISGKTVNVFDGDGNILSSEISELTLKNCEFEIASSKSGKSKLVFGEREFMADDITFRQQDDGSCLVTLKNEPKEKR